VVPGGVYLILLQPAESINGRPEQLSQKQRVEHADSAWDVIVAPLPEIIGMLLL